jgi:hypothetical protein
MSSDAIGILSRTNHTVGSAAATASGRTRKEGGVNSISSPTVAATVADEHVFLIGRPPLAEYFAFLEAETLEGQLLDRREAGDVWRTANDHVRQLERDEAGLPDGTSVEPMPDELAAIREAILSDAVVQRSFAVVPIDVGMVELDRLVVFQKRINIAYVRELQATLPDVPTHQELLGFALPLDRRYDPPVSVVRISANQWQLSSPSTDFRPVGFVEVDPSAATSGMVNGVPKAVLGAALGYGPNFLTAIKMNDRLILVNGSHRAFALRDKGVKHAPCLIQQVSRIEELELVGAGEIFERRDLYVNAPRPPLLKDYFDTKLRIAVQVPRRGRQILVGITVQQIAA